LPINTILYHGSSYIDSLDTIFDKSIYDKLWTSFDKDQAKYHVFEDKCERYFEKNQFPYLYPHLYQFKTKKTFNLWILKIINNDHWIEIMDNNCIKKENLINYLNNLNNDIINKYIEDNNIKNIKFLKENNKHILEIIKLYNESINQENENDKINGYICHNDQCEIAFIKNDNFISYFYEIKLSFLEKIQTILNNKLIDQSLHLEKQEVEQKKIQLIMEVNEIIKNINEIVSNVNKIFKNYKIKYLGNWIVPNMYSKKNIMNKSIDIIKNDINDIKINQNIKEIWEKIKNNNNNNQEMIKEDNKNIENYIENYTKIMKEIAGKISECSSLINEPKNSIINLFKYYTKQKQIGNRMLCFELIKTLCNYIHINNYVIYSENKMQVDQRFTCIYTKEIDYEKGRDFNFYTEQLEQLEQL